MEVRAEVPIYTDSLEVFFREKEFDKISALVFSSPSKIDIEPGGVFPVGLSLDRDVAQKLFEEMWRLGFRPKNGESSLAHVAALHAHIADLRKIVFRDAGGLP